TTTATVTSHRAAFYLGIHASAVQAAGMPFGVDLVAPAPDGTRVATPAHVALVRGDRVIAERDVSLAALGSHTEAFVAAEPGEYTLRVTAATSAVARELCITGKGDATWSHANGEQFTLVAGKPRYAPG